MEKPLCFVLMPFGRKKNAAGVSVDFDFIYEHMIAPAVEDAGLEPLRADAEEAGGIIHKPMYERLILCKYAVADLSTGNANVFYELGLRHAVRPWSTVMLYSNDGTQMPFDVRPLRTIPYKVTNSGRPAEAGATRRQLAEVIRAVRRSEAAKPHHDSPVFQVVEGYPPLDTSGIRSELFAEHMRAVEQRRQIAAARGGGRAALRRAA